MTRGILTTLAFAGLLAGARAQDPAVAYRRATIETVGKAGRLENATLVVRGDKIVAVGVNAEVPDDAKVIDAAGKTILPGFIEPYRVFGAPAQGTGQGFTIIGGNIVPIGGGGDDGGGSFTKVADTLNPYDRDYRLPLRSGITILNHAPPGYGQTAVLGLTPDKPDAMLKQADGLLTVVVTNSPAALDRLRQGLEGAAKIRNPAPTGAASPMGTSASSSGSGGSGGTPPSGGQAPMGSGTPMTTTPPATQSPLQKLWLDVYDGKQPILTFVQNPTAVAHVVKLADKYKGVKWALAGAPATYVEAIDKLKGRGFRALVRPGVDRMPFTRDRFNAPRMLHEAGLEVCFTQIGTPPAETPDMPLFNAAMAIKGGLPRQVALEALTIRPATLLGMEKTLGSLEEGKAATFVVFEGDPFAPNSRLRQAVVDGRTVHEN
ncbi:MAG TPA: amidohydrolase family protein [Planctomycetia bacterium]|nr:amidohydrolase family protein [Planctomycetia bacterium]